MNHHQPKTTKVASYGFALIVSVFLAIFSLEWSYRDGEGFAIAPKDPPPIGLLVPGLTLVGLALGVQIDSSTVVEVAQNILPGQNKQK